MADGNKYVFGIDLGTTYSCIAYVNDNHFPEVIKNGEGDNTTPSVVYFEDADTVVVGKTAKESSFLEPDNAVSFVKRIMGETKDIGRKIYNKEWRPETISAEILKKIAYDAGKALGTEVKDVVITVPAYFGTNARAATESAGKIAGLNVVDIISEPTAAALFYGVTKVDNGGQAKNILVYDLGGGTFDVTVLKINADKHITVVCSEGNRELGGKDWDTKLQDLLVEHFIKETGFDGEFSEEDEQEIAGKVEGIKQTLSAKESTSVPLKLDGGKAKFTVTREEFETATKELMDETLEKTKEVIANAKTKGCDRIHEILLVGGSTRMPQVEKELQRAFGIPTQVTEPDEAVAKGAAIYAVGAYEGKVEKFQELANKGKLSAEDKKEAENYKEKAAVSSKMILGLAGKTLSEVLTLSTTKSYALETCLDGDENNKKCYNLIKKNCEMTNGVISVSEQFYTISAWQTGINLKVYESDFEEDYYDINLVPILGECSLKFPKPMPKDSPIEVTFTLEKSGILKVHGKDLSSDAFVDAEMKASNGVSMTEEEIAAAASISKGIRLG